MAAGMKFFLKIKRMSKGFKSAASFGKDQHGKMVTYIKSSLDLWRAHFNGILNFDDTTISAKEMIRSSRPNTGQYYPSCTNRPGKKRPWPFRKPVVMMASLLKFLKQEEMS